MCNGRAAFGPCALSTTFMVLAGESTDFAPYLDTARPRHKAKRNFIQRLDGIKDA